MADDAITIGYQLKKKKYQKWMWLTDWVRLTRVGKRASLHSASLSARVNKKYFSIFFLFIIPFPFRVEGMGLFFVPFLLSCLSEDTNKKEEEDETHLLFTIQFWLLYCYLRITTLIQSDFPHSATHVFLCVIRCSFVWWYISYILHNAFLGELCFACVFSEWM